MHTLLLTILLIVAGSLSAGEITPAKNINPSKLINGNPDPQGEPWIVGGLDWSEEAVKKLEKLPVLDLSYRRISLPSNLDNSKNKFFRPVFNQGNFGSCAQASSIGYNLTYEINRINNSSASSSSSQLPPLFTYNFLNNADGNVGSMTTDGWDIINTTGCPYTSDFGGNGVADNCTKWMSGYEKYYKSMSIRVPVSFRVITKSPEGINTLRQWLFDKGNGTKDGALVNFSAGADAAFQQLSTTLPSGTPESGKKVVTKFGTQVNHAMTIVGYNDSVRYDFNKDGKYTNEGTDVTKWEVGAFILLNSWGTTWADGGFAYLPYRLMAIPSSQGGLGGNFVVGCTGSVGHKTQMTYKVRVQYSNRGDISFKAGIATDPNATQAEKILTFGAFNYQGGNKPMTGSSEQIDIALDVTPLLKYLNSPKNKFFLIIEAKSGGKGSVVSYSLMDYRGVSGVETSCPDQNVTIKAGSNVLAISYESSVPDLAITTNKLDPLVVGKDYSYKLKASGGKGPYTWTINKNTYLQETMTESFPSITDKKITLDDSDDGFGGQELAFEFPYFGSKYKKIYVSTDGSLGFDPVFEIARHASAIPRAKIICPIGMDFKYGVEQGDGIYYKGDDKSATFRWNIKSLFDDTKVNFDVAVTLYPTGEFKVFYRENLTKNMVDFACGFSAGNQKDYVIFPYGNTSDVPNGCVMKFTPFALPSGLSMANDGTLSGKTTVNCDNLQIVFTCTDSEGLGKEKTLGLSSGTAIVNPIFNNGHLPFTAQSQKNGLINVTLNTKIDNKVTLNLYTLDGQKVVSLINDYLTSGKHTFSFNRASLRVAHNGIFIAKCSINDKLVSVSKLMFLE